MITLVGRSKLAPCALAKWKLKRNMDCKKLRQRWDGRWQPGRHKKDIENLKRSIEKLKKWIAENCCE